MESVQFEFARKGHSTLIQALKPNSLTAQYRPFPLRRIRRTSSFRSNKAPPVWRT